MINLKDFIRKPTRISFSYEIVARLKFQIIRVQTALGSRQ